MISVDNNQKRLKEGQPHCILDASLDSDFDSITQLLSKICGTPFATLILNNCESECYRSLVGLDKRQNTSEADFCAKVIQSKDILIIGDTLLDPLFVNNPMVIGEPHFRFYAGVPLISHQGHVLGTLSVKDSKPKTKTTSN